MIRQPLEWETHHCVICKAPYPWPQGLLLDQLHICDNADCERIIINHHLESHRRVLELRQTCPLK